MAREYPDYPSWKRQWEKEHDTVRVPHNYEESMALRRNSMTKSWPTKEETAAYVAALLQPSQSDLLLTIIIEPAKSGGFYVHSATVASSVVTRMLNFFFGRGSI